MFNSDNFLHILFSVIVALGAYSSARAESLPNLASSPTQQIAASSHLLWLKPDGSVWASGRHESGARGDSEEKVKVRTRFQPIQGLKEVVQIAVYDDTSAALKANGTVWVWGSFYFERNNKPKLLSGANDTRAIAIGGDFIVGLKRDGSVWVGGPGKYVGGSNSKKNQLVVAIPGMTDVIAVGATDYAALVVKRDGTVWGWGNGFGKILGSKGKWNFFEDLDKSINPQPIRIEGVANIATLSGGERHMLALTQDGKVYAWGDNEDGALGVPIRKGIGDTAYQFPELISGLPKIKAIAAGYDFSLAMDMEGKVWSWGNNTYGTLGHDRTKEDEIEKRGFIPKPIKGIDKAVAIYAGHYHGFAVLANGKVTGWGENRHDFIPIASSKPSGFLPPTPIE